MGSCQADWAGPPLGTPGLTPPNQRPAGAALRSRVQPAVGHLLRLPHPLHPDGQGAVGVGVGAWGYCGQGGYSLAGHCLVGLAGPPMLGVAPAGLARRTCVRRARTTPHACTDARRGCHPPLSSLQGWKWMNRISPTTWIIYGLSQSQLGDQSTPMVLPNGQVTTVANFM